jgi:hypothetical protein
MLSDKLEIAHKELKKDNLALKAVNNRKNEGLSEFFLYNLKNYLLCGLNCDRT